LGAGAVLALAALFWVSPNTAQQLTESALRICVGVTNEVSNAFLGHLLSDLSPVDPVTPDGPPTPAGSTR
jgi:hypothetical protein